MAIIGVSKPYVAKYTDTEGAVSYTEGTVLAKAVEYNAEITATEDNDLYADNQILESEKSFASGKVELTTDDFTQDASSLILGIIPQEITIGDETYSELVYDDNMNSPFLGLGLIIDKQRNGKMYHRAVVFTKTKASIPGDSAKTKGKEIEWQTPVLPFAIFRDDSTNHAWKREATFESRDLAEEYIKQVLNIG